MLKFILTFLCCVYGILAETSFIKNGKRAKIFELTDNEVPTFKITLPKNDFDTLKEYAVVKGLERGVSRFSDTLEGFYNYAKEQLELITKINFKEEFPGVNLELNFKELKIGSDGYSKINVEEVLSAYDRNIKHYANLNFKYDNPYFYFTASNKYVDIATIESRMSHLKSLNKKDNPVSKNNSSSSSALSSFLDTSVTNQFNDIEEDNKFIEEAKFPTSLEIEHSINNSNDKEKSNLVKRSESDEPKDYKTKNATMIVEIAGEHLEYNKVTLSLGGKYTRYLSKPNFNIKIRGDQDLYGRSQFKLRSDYAEPTFLRSKLTSDIYDRLGLFTVSANYATLYINDEYMGLFVLTDSIKFSWIKHVFNDDDEESNRLMKCTDGATISLNARHECVSEKGKQSEGQEIVEKKEEWLDLLETINTSSYYSNQLENKMDKHQFLYAMAVEFLLGSWDNYRNGNNFYLYYNPVDKHWVYLPYDFDHTFGVNMDRVFVGHIYEDLPENYGKYNTNYPEYSIDKWFYNEPLDKYVILRDRSKFYDILKDVVKKVFNPAILFPRIDELKAFIRPYVEREYTPDENGHYPGRMNSLASSDYTFAKWDANSEFTTVESVQYFVYGIKYWILARYRYICHTFAIECDSTYTNENYEFPIDNEVRFEGYFKNYFTQYVKDHEKEFTCKAELIGYPCCPSNVTRVDYQDEHGDWNYDQEKNEWCGLTPYCWSETLNYSCCKGCEVVTTDKDGKWGVENNEWCGIPHSCK